jgi:eukaryotic-like serine/threonine-protein kinase
VPDLSGTILEGKYELIKLIGEGGMGAVYEAKHRLIGRRLAVKFLHSQYTSNEEVVIRFQREAQAAAAIGHDNIIEVTDMGQTTEGAPFLVMEYLDGFDVRELLAEVECLSTEQAAHIMVQSLSALQAAHNAGIIHRDLKPENIYLIEKSDKKDYVKLLDFGISKFRSLETEGMKGLTQTGTVLGTPYYMSPEQARGDQNIGPKSDIYAMGVILFQMLTGTLPFDAPNYNALLIKILTEDPPDPLDIKPDLPGDMVETIRIAMSRDIDDRFADCSVFRERLLPYVPGASTAFQTKMSSASRTAVRAALSTTSTPLEMTRSGGLSPRRRNVAPIVLGALSVAAAAVGAFFFFRDVETRPVPITAPVVAPTPEAETQPEPAKTPVSEPKEEKQEEVSLKITAKPKSARIAIDGVIGVGNPYESKVGKDDAAHQIVITAEGYEPLTAEVKFNENRELAYTLTKEEPKKKRSRRDKKKDAVEGASAKPKHVRKDKEETKPAESKPEKKRPRRRIDDEDPWS